ncbi:MAG: TonB-dependent receptor domain-containing protein [Thermoanaerobaculia bacterium]
MRITRFLAVIAALVLASVPAFAQSSVTGFLTGTVTSDGQPLPGATVTVTSPNLQGSRTAVSDANGNYNIAALPPGDYTVRVELEGLQSVTRNTRVTLGGTARVDADLKVSSFTESITVTATGPAVMETTEVQTNYQKETVDNLPIQRNVNAIALLSPGVTANGPRNAIQISGAFSSDNLIVVNGANIQENLRGQARPLFIEDAIQETTVITGAVSAEYGRFTGGVISSITKSGGNEFSGSLRDSLTNAAGTDASAFGEEKPESKINNVYEATLGGRIIRDRLWFFGAGRVANTSTLGNPVHLTGENIVQDQENTRYEVKLTGQISANHSLMVNYLNNPLTFTNDNQLGVFELRALDADAEQQEDFKAARYSGIFTNSLLGEINYSERTFTFVGFGGDNTDPYEGTPIYNTAGAVGVANAPYFCGSCDNEQRNNELITAKLTYFLGTSGFGTHNIVGGVDRYNEFRLSNNYQSPTNFVIIPTQVAPVLNGANQAVFTFTEFDFFAYYPVEIPSIGSDITTQSVFLNDKWDLNSHWSFNLGARYDRTEGNDSEGNPTADDSALSPRVGATYDISGNGRVKLSASYGKYIGRLAEGVQGSGSAAGEPWGIYFLYDGPTITGTSDQVVHQVIDWFNAQGGTDYANWQGVYNPILVIGGVSTKLAGKLKAPGVDEWTIGAGFQLTPNSYVRADYINRDWNNYYVSVTNQETGNVVEPISGAPSDLTLVSNTNDLDRKYEAIQLAANARFFSRLNVGANYTYSKLTGNAEGENTGSGPISTGGWIFQYPEYQGFSQNSPYGYLNGDQRHKLRAWAAMDFPIGAFGTVNVSVLERFDSALPYSISFQALAEADPNASGDPDEQFGYISAPETVTYFVGERGSQRWEDVTATDLALNYRLPLGKIEFFTEGEIINLFNEQAQINGNTSVVRTATAFNPFTETPVEGTHYTKGASFGQARSSLDYQQARTYRLSLGFRF